LDLVAWQVEALTLMLAEYHLRESRETASRMLIPLITYLNEAKGNKTLRYYAFLLAAGDTQHHPGALYSELARKIGVTRAALSKAVIEMQGQLGLTAHNGFQKSGAGPREFAQSRAPFLDKTTGRQGEHTQ
jgi:hypothetical protein